MAKRKEKLNQGPSLYHKTNNLSDPLIGTNGFTGRDIELGTYIDAQERYDYLLGEYERLNEAAHNEVNSNKKQSEEE